MIHKLKILKQFADAIISGDKNFEVRKNDRGFQKGDVISFQVIDEERYYPHYCEHFLNGKSYEITYVLTGWGIEEGYCVLSIKEVKE